MPGVEKIQSDFHMTVNYHLICLHDLEDDLYIILWC